MGRIRRALLFIPPGCDCGRGRPHSGKPASVLVWPAAGARTATAAATTAAFTGWTIATAAIRGSEDRELLFKLCGAALRTFGVFPIAGTDEDFAVASAFFAMKLVNRHAGRITLLPEISSWNQQAEMYDFGFGSKAPQRHFAAVWDKFSQNYKPERNYEQTSICLSAIDRGCRSCFERMRFQPSTGSADSHQPDRRHHRARCHNDYRAGYNNDYGACGDNNDDDANDTNGGLIRASATATA